MPPRSPLPRRDGLDASWIRTPDNGPVAPPWATMRDFLLARVGARTDVDAALAGGRFVDGSGRPWAASDAYRGNAYVWFHRERAAEPRVPGDLAVLFEDERIVVVDKPHFLATTPRGAHVTESVVARLRLRDGYADVAPAHRLDRLTAGVLLLTTQRRWRAPYAGLFATGLAVKTYEAVAPLDPHLSLPQTLTGRIEKRRGQLQAGIVEGEPNAVTTIALLTSRGGFGHYRLTPTTGRTHQLRLHLASLGIPIVGDPLYPDISEVEPDDFTSPLQLVARRLSFTDPVDGSERSFVSGAALVWPDGVPVTG